MRGSFPTCFELSKQVSRPVSADTINRFLRRTNHSYKRNKRCPALTEANKARRVAWAKKYRDAAKRKWVFSDSKIFEGQRTGVKGEYSWCKAGESKSTTTYKYSSYRLHVYGAVSYYGNSSCHLVTGTTGLKSKYFQKNGVTKLVGVGAREYCDVLRTGGSGNGVGLIEEMDRIMRVNKVKDWVWQQDNPNVHKGVEANDFIMTKVGQKLDWPGNSPDLSPIENVWAEVERRLWEGPKWRDQAEFEVRVKAAWRSVSTDRSYMINLWKTIRVRINLLLKNNGEKLPF